MRKRSRGYTDSMLTWDFSVPWYYIKEGIPQYASELKHECSKIQIYRVFVSSELYDSPPVTVAAR